MIIYFTFLNIKNPLIKDSYRHKPKVHCKSFKFSKSGRKKLLERYEKSEQPLMNARYTYSRGNIGEGGRE